MTADWLEVVWYDIGLAGGRVIWYLIGWRSCDMISNWLEVMWYDMWLAGGHVICDWLEVMWYVIGWRSCDMWLAGGRVISDWLEVMWYVLHCRSRKGQWFRIVGSIQPLDWHPWQKSGTYVRCCIPYMYSLIPRPMLKNVLLHVLWPHSQANA